MTNEITPTPSLMDVKQVAKLLNVSTKIIYKMIAQNTIPYLTVNKKYLFSLNTILKWIEEKSIQPTN